MLFWDLWQQFLKCLCCNFYFADVYVVIFTLQVLYTCTTARAFKIIGALWAVALISAIPFFFIAQTTEAFHHYFKRQVTQCLIPITTAMEKTYIITITLVLFVIPLLLLMLLYGFIGRQLAKESSLRRSTHTGLTNHRNNRASNSQTLRTRKQVIVMLAIIIVLFFVCLLPLRVFTLWNVYSSDSEKNSLGFERYMHVLSFARIMHYINSAINPVVYNVVSTKFRSAFLRTVCRRAFALRRLSGMSMVVSSQSFLSRGSIMDHEMNYRSTNID